MENYGVWSVLRTVNAMNNEVLIRHAYQEKGGLLIDLEESFQFSFIRVTGREVFPFAVESGADFKVHELLYKTIGIVISKVGIRLDKPQKL